MADHLQQLSQLWHDQALCDCILASREGTRHHAHRIVLAASCDYFKLMFASSTAEQMAPAASEDGRTLVELPQLTAAQVQACLHVIYDRQAVRAFPRHIL